jgi:hypothetical protein
VKKVQIMEVQVDRDDRLLITFSDGTIAGYPLKELMALRPLRESVREATRAPLLGLALVTRAKRPS